jgi:signal transduction histidine kinase
MQEGIRVLVADDDPDIRELVEFKLAQAGYAVTAVPDGAAAWAAFESDPPALAVLDVTRVAISVTDTGIGIPHEDLEQLGSRFFRASNATKQAIPGTGLGLAIVRTIVEGHGGEMFVASAEGEGTTVRLFLPSAAAAPS